MPDSTPLPTKSKPPPPCRLYVILARSAPVGVIFRRGPSKRVQIIHWNTATDTFTPGQWFHGRIYEKRSDISPSGNLLIYSTMKPSARAWTDTYTDSWTAISKPPYLTALALWPCHASIGGGLFLTENKVWLNYYGQPEAHPNHLPEGLKITSGEEVMEEVLLHRRLERDGWQHVQEWSGEFIGHSSNTAYRREKKAILWTGEELVQSPSGLDTVSGYVTHAPSIHEKPHLNQSLTLVLMTTITEFQHQYAYSVRDGEGHEEKFAGAEWADWDQHGRLVFAQKGKMFALAADAIGQHTPQELVDLNENKPEAVEAPNWARVW